MTWWVLLEFLFGCTLLGWGAERFIAGSVGVAKRFGMSPLLIGVVLIGFGTTFPEIVVAIIASAHHKPDMAIGNAVGSCITNIALVISLTILIAPIMIRSTLLKREFPFLLIISVIVSLMLLSGHLTRFDGVVFLIILFLYLWFLMYFLPKDKTMEHAAIDEVKDFSDKSSMTFTVALAWWVFGLLLLFASSELIVYSASAFARWLHISDLVIGLTVVAVGTSLPELAATIITARRKQHDMAIGNIIGSNVFNILAVLAMPALIAPSVVSKGLLHRDLPVMIGLTILLWILSVSPPNRMRLGRVSGVILLACYVGYVLLVIA
ncbi:MAG: calcium/sodium antiporter [Gammaproteobacteria bacterium]|nr:calcium/sodium antiporter [Gammaproteobacteria bacterium]